MVREVRVAWNDPDAHQRMRSVPLEDDDNDDGDESPLEPPPKRRCSCRRRTDVPLPLRTDPAPPPSSTPNSAAD